MGAADWSGIPTSPPQRTRTPDDYVHPLSRATMGTEVDPRAAQPSGPLQRFTRLTDELGWSRLK